MGNGKDSAVRQIERLRQTDRVQKGDDDIVGRNRNMLRRKCCVE